MSLLIPGVTGSAKAQLVLAQIDNASQSLSALLNEIRGLQAQAQQLRGALLDLTPPQPLGPEATTEQRAQYQQQLARYRQQRESVEKQLQALGEDVAELTQALQKKEQELNELQGVKLTAAQMEDAAEQRRQLDDAKQAYGDVARLLALLDQEAEDKELNREKLGLTPALLAQMAHVSATARGQERAQVVTGVASMRGGMEASARGVAGTKKPAAATAAWKPMPVAAGAGLPTELAGRQAGRQGDPIAALPVSAANKARLQALSRTVVAVTQNSSGSAGTSWNAASMVQDDWNELIGRMQLNGDTDINALVQAVLRESYQNNTDDLRFFASKVKFFNALKDNIRDELTRLRQVRAELSPFYNQDGSANVAAMMQKQPPSHTSGNGEAYSGNPKNWNPSVDGQGGLRRWAEEQLAAPHGGAVEYSGTPSVTGEVEVKGVAAVDWATAGGRERLDDAIKKMEEKLNSVGDDAQLANVDLQNAMQRQQQTLQLLSNISKMMHDNAMSIIRKIG